MSLNRTEVPMYEMVELTFQHAGHYENRHRDVNIEAAFTSPSGRIVRVGGFHYGSDVPPRIERTVVKDARGRERAQVNYILDREDIWKVRFAPAELGEWRFNYVFRDVAGGQATGDGTFRCVPAPQGVHGFVRQDPDNPFQWICDDGTPFFPIGMQDGVSDYLGLGTLLGVSWFMDGPFREPRPPGALPLPSGPEFRTGRASPVSAEQYFSAFAGAGFNTWRFSNGTGGYMALFNVLDHPDTYRCKMLDDFFVCLRQKGFRIFFTIFGDLNKAMFRTKPENLEDIAKVKRFIEYCVWRWGPLVDFWELLNEQYPDDEWLCLMSAHLKAVDPYRYPVSTSYEKPELAGIDINSPHWYSQDENELESDIMTVERCMEWRRFGKPVILGEQGNDRGRQRHRDIPRPGMGGNWDPRSAVRMRLRLWTAFCHEVAFIFWHTGYAKDGHHSNIWLGPEERQYVRAFAQAVRALGGGITKTRPLADRQVSVTDYAHVRGYQIFTRDGGLAYLHHFSDHTTPVKDCRLIFNVPRAGKGYWYAPEDGRALAVVELAQGKQTLVVPEFTIDIALLVNPATPPVP